MKPFDPTNPIDDAAMRAAQLIANMLGVNPSDRAHMAIDRSKEFLTEFEQRKIVWGPF